jgi:hypothetical protein
LPSDGAPKVKNPLEVSRFEQNPCLSLTQAQVQALNLGPQGTPREAPLGQACTWTNTESQGFLDIAFLGKDPRGLSATYKANKDGRWAYFVEYPDIEGFPAVASDQRDERKSGSCILEVGVSDKLSFHVGIRLSRANVGQKDPCDVAAQVAGMALKTMKAGG